MLSVGGLFDGIGLLAYGLHLAGLEHAWLCEVDPWRRGILEQRFPGIPVYDDVRAVGAGTAEPVHIVAGGFPCKGASSAGRQEGFGHPETVLWREMARAVRELRPRYVVVENVANILALHDGAVWGEVLGDLAALGYDITWDCIPAGAVGAPHLRDRVFAVASHADRGGGPAGAGGPVPQRDSRSGQDGTAAVGGAADAPDAAPARLEGPRLPGRAAERGASAADAGGERRQQVADRAHGDEVADAGRRAVADHEPVGPSEGAVPAAVEWGAYQPAIDRWARALGRPAPEPLLRGVGPRGSRRVERSRVSALGDGVQVQVGQLVGAYIVGLERERMTSAAAFAPLQQSEETR